MFLAALDERDLRHLTVSLAGRRASRLAIIAAMQPAPVRQGTLRTDGRTLPLRATEITATLHGPVARVTVRQRFVNATLPGEPPRPADCDYVFPLPPRAGVTAMSMRIGDRVVRATVKEREEAKRQFQAAQRAGRRAALLEEDAPSLFSLGIANVPPDAEVVVELSYDDVLYADRGTWTLVIPMTAEDRYLDTPAVPGRRVRPPRPLDPSRDADVSVAIEIPDGELFGAPSCPSHDVVVAKEPGLQRVTLAEGEKLANRDFKLVLPDAAGDAVRPRVWFEREDDRPGTFLLALSPQRDPVRDVSRARGEGTNLSCGNCGAPLRDAGRLRALEGGGTGFRCEHCGVVARVPDDAHAHRPGLARDVVVLFDRSMSTERGHRVAKRALLEVLGALGPSDAFQLVAFDHATERLDEGEAWIPTGEAALARARAFVDERPPRGGTELEDAFARAAELPKRRDRQRLVVLVGDCAVGNEGRLVRRASELFDGSRLFVLATGPSPHVHLATRLAETTGGAWDLAATEDDAEAVARFADRVRQASPVLSDVAVTLEDALSADVYPQPIAALFHGQTLLVLGRYTTPGPTRLVVTARTSTGGEFRQEVDVVAPTTAKAIGLGRLWAKRRIEARLAHLEGHPDAKDDVRLEVLGLALRHQLVTPYSSLVAEDTETPASPPEEDETEEAAPSSSEVEGFAAGGPPPGAPPPAGAPMPRSMAYGAPPPPAMAPAPLAAPMPARGELLMRTAAAAPKGEGFFGAVKRKIFGAADDEGGGDGGSDEPPPVGTEEKEAYGEKDLEGLGGAVGELDLVFVVDETGSMGAYIREVQSRLRQLVRALSKSPLCKSLRIGVVGYRDHPPQDASFVTRVSPLSADIDEVARGIDRMEAQGGGDSPEAATDGLFDGVRLDFRPGAARVCIWIADAPPHGVDPRGDGFPDGCPCKHHWYTQAECAREMGIVIHAVLCGGGDVVRDVMKKVAETTMGELIPLARAELLVPLIEAAASTDLDRQRVRERVAAVVREHEASLVAAPPDEQQRFVRDVLRDEGVRARTFTTGSGRPVLGFRDVETKDVAFALDALRRMRRISW